jgi:hypothetical protein
LTTNVSLHSVSNGAIGGIVGAIPAVAIAGIAGFVYYKLKSRSSKASQDNLEAVQTEGSGAIVEMSGHISGLVYAKNP